jgi:alkyldihydroxyacetonephosphate synthase
MAAADAATMIAVVGERTQPACRSERRSQKPFRVPGGSIRRVIQATTPSGTDVVAELTALLGAGAVAADEAELAARTRDCWPLLIMRERSGERLPRPQAVVWPDSTDATARLYRWASERGVPLVPYGGGGGVTGGAAPVPGCVMVDTKRMADILDLDETSGIVRVQAGVIGQQLEEWLGARGWTLGHFPSSITVSSVGGFAAARSAGQLSTKYGKFEHMVCGLDAVLADGTVVRLIPRPASAAGPDLGGLLLGSEGTLGVITELHLRVHPAPERLGFQAFRLPSFAAGLATLRGIMRTGTRPAVLRLYDQTETALFHAEAGEGCLLVAVTEGWAPLVDLELRAVAEAVGAHAGERLGEQPARDWHAHRYDVSFRFADFIKPGGAFGDAVAVDTCELAASWSRLMDAYEHVRAALSAHMDLVLCHASHCYPDGAALYFTFGAAGDGDERVAQQRYRAAWTAAMETAVAAGATITHHHGIGLLRAEWLAAELGPGGAAMLRRLKAALDPAGIANPGKLGLGGVA